MICSALQKPRKKRERIEPQDAQGRYRQRNRERGCCPDCGRSTDGRCTYCGKCRVKRRLASAAYYQRRKSPPAAKPKAVEIKVHAFQWEDEEHYQRYLEVRHAKEQEVARALEELRAKG